MRLSGPRSRRLTSQNYGIHTLKWTTNYQSTQRHIQEGSILLLQSSFTCIYRPLHYHLLQKNLGRFSYEILHINSEGYSNRPSSRRRPTKQISAIHIYTITTSPPSVSRISRKCRSLEVSDPEPPRPVTGISFDREMRTLIRCHTLSSKFRCGQGNSPAWRCNICTSPRSIYFILAIRVESSTGQRISSRETIRSGVAETVNYYYQWHILPTSCRNPLPLQISMKMQAARSA
jgi:hypothetical protein